MSKSHPEAKPLPQTFDEASDWFVRFRIGEVDTHAREAFNAWLCRSPDHIRAYLQIAQTYADVPALKGKTRLDLEKLVDQARSDANVVELDRSSSPLLALQSTPRTRGSSRRRPLLALAAGVALVAFGTLGWWAVDAYRAPTYATTIGEQRSIMLTDGSTVALNAKSRLRIRLTEHERTIDLLAGQALFHVAKDKDRPFVVHSGGTTIRAVGTEFDVYRRSNGTTVTVIEGRVAILANDASASSLSPASQTGNNTGRGAQQNSLEPPAELRVRADLGEVYLSAGEQLVVAQGSAIVPRKTKSNAAIAWTQRQLVFDGTSLPEVVEEFNRYNTRPLVIRGSDLSGLHISGIYSSTDPASLVRFLKAEFGLKVTEESGQLVIRRE